MVDVGAIQGAGLSAPDAPTVVAGDEENTLSWSAVSGATSYNAYFGTSAGVTKLNGTLITGITSPYDHTGLVNGTTYYYVLTAEDSETESDESSESSGTPEDPPPPITVNAKTRMLRF